ncbi:MAG: response regulator [Bryobacterales bacterium]|nr:response regulator [Bryobacterales bacterium]
MSRILLADDSPHAQRMGERILREEGFEVVSVTDGETAIIRLGDVDPDVVIADALLPRKSGYELCEFIKSQPRHRHVRVLLTAGLLEPFDEERARQVSSDGLIKKPFEASAVVAMVKPLVEAAGLARAAIAEVAGAEPEAADSGLDPEMVRAAVTLAVDAAMPALVEGITKEVVERLRSHAR